MGKNLFAMTAGVGLLLAAVPLVAHHSFAAEYDANKRVKFQGTVTKMEWINPHAWIHVDVKSQDGKIENWMVECGPPTTLYRRGFTKNSLPIGTAILVDGYRAKDGTNKANGRELTLPNGQTLFMGSSGTGAPYDTKKK